MKDRKVKRSVALMHKLLALGKDGKGREALQLLQAHLSANGGIPADVYNYTATMTALANSCSSTDGAINSGGVAPAPNGSNSWQVNAALELLNDI